MEETQILNSNKFKYIKPSIIIINVDTSYMVMTSGTGKYVYTRDLNGETITTTSYTREVILGKNFGKVWVDMDMTQMEIKCLQTLIILLKNYIINIKYNIKIEEALRLESCLKIGYTS